MSERERVMSERERVMFERESVGDGGGDGVNAAMDAMENGGGPIRDVCWK